MTLNCYIWEEISVEIGLKNPYMTAKNLNKELFNKENT